MVADEFNGTGSVRWQNSAFLLQIALIDQGSSSPLSWPFFIGCTWKRSASVNPHSCIKGPRSFCTLIYPSRGADSRHNHGLWHRYFQRLHFRSCYKCRYCCLINSRGYCFTSCKFFCSQILLLLSSSSAGSSGSPPLPSPPQSQPAVERLNLS